MTRRPLATITAALAGIALLAGCAGQPAITAETAGELQASVVSVATLAQTDAAAALAELDALEGRLDTASADGSIQADRATDIRSNIDLVRADLTTLVAAAEAKAAADRAAAEQAAAEKAAADQAAADEAARQAAEDSAEDDKEAREDAREEEKERREQEKDDRKEP